MLRFLLPAVFLLAACDPATSIDAPGDTPVEGCEWAEVERVVDGDTIIAEVDGDRERVRYIGIDTPEFPSGGVPEPFAQQASDRNEELLADGAVCLESDISNRDRFDRLLRYVWLEDGTLVNEVLLREGLATIVTFPPDVKYHESRYEPAQDEAREARRGLWAN